MKNIKYISQKLILNQILKKFDYKVKLISNYESPNGTKRAFYLILSILISKVKSFQARA